MRKSDIPIYVDGVRAGTTDVEYRFSLIKEVSAPRGIRTFVLFPTPTGIKGNSANPTDLEFIYSGPIISISKRRIVFVFAGMIGSIGIDRPFIRIRRLD